MLPAFLNKPFPHADLNKKTVVYDLLVGCFVALFLIVFEPFEISEWQTNNKILKLAGFGIVSFIVPMLIHLFMALFILKKTSEDNWTVGKEIVTIIAVIVLIALGNMFYGSALQIIPFTLKGFLFAFISVLLIGVFPISLHVLRKHNKFLKINSVQAQSVNQHLQQAETKVENKTGRIAGEMPIPNKADAIAAPVKLIFIAENEKDRTELFPEQLLYIESADNYSNIVFIENDKLKKQLIRSSLKRLESQVTFEFIVRCHRTFIVNLKNVKKVEGNAAGYKLSFDKAEFSVPVSRNFGNSVIEKLKNLK